MERKDLLAIGALTFIITIITFILLNNDLNIGVYYVRDVYGYLNNALYFAGYESGVPALRGLSPVIPLITSLFFRLGFIYDGTILIVSSLFYILLAIGIYLLFRLKFDEELSFLGAFIFSTFPIIVVWVSKGMLDIPGLCISIWSIYFMILSFKRNIKYLYIAFPLFIIGFFTRYTVALILPVLLIQFLLIENPIKYVKTNIKPIIISGLISAATLLIFLGIYNYFELPMFFISQTQTISSSSASGASTPVSNNLVYYLNNLLIYMGTGNFIPYSLKPGYFSINSFNWSGGYPSLISYIYGIILIIGLIFSIKKATKPENKEKLNKQEYKNVKLGIFLLFLLIFIITFSKISIIYSLILISISLLSLYHYLNKGNFDNLNLDFIMFYLFIIYLVFFTYHTTKVDRYAMTLMPFIAYAIISSIKLIYERFEMEQLKKIIPVALILIILLTNGFYFMTNEPHTFDNQVHYNLVNASSEEKIVGEWLMSYDPDYQNKTIWANRGGDMSFILKMMIPSIESTNGTNFTDVLQENNVTYFITSNSTISEPYVKIFQNGEVSLYKVK